MKKFLTQRETMMKQMTMVFSLIVFMCLNASAQCVFTNCPNQPITAEAAPGECSTAVVLPILTTNNGCGISITPNLVQYPIGTTIVTYETDDGDICEVTVIVTEFGGAIGSVSCNDLVQVSLDDMCEVVITPDIVTEGGPYGCFDLFTVEIEGIDGNVITAPGTYQVTVTTPAGNSCWGVVVVEDKVGPVLDCKNVHTYCSQSILPGATVCEYEIEEDENDGDLSFDIATDDPDAVLKEITVELEILTTEVSELEVILYTAEGTQIDLFANAGVNAGPDGCVVPNINVWISEDGLYTALEMEDHCGLGVSGVVGSFQPLDPFSDAFGEDPNGTWTVEIINNGIADFEAFGTLTIGATVDTICWPVDVTGGIEELGANQYLIDGFGDCGPIHLLYQDKVIPDDCQSDLWETVERTWIGTDASGNQSQCLQIITVERPTLEFIQYPKDYDGFEFPALKCYDDFPLDENDHPHPSHTGSPAFPSGYACPNIQYSYEDLRIDICPTSYKLIRTWSCLDWCTGEVETEVQIIKVVDDLPPYFSCPIDDYDYYITGTYDCFTDFVVPHPVLDSLHLECSDTSWYIEYKVFVGHPIDCVEPADTKYRKTGVTYGSDGTVTIEELPKGCVWIKYVVKDDCDNYYEQVCKVNIHDGTPPIAVCIEKTVASIGANGCVKVFAESFDNGSHDNCAIEYIGVRRMTVGDIYDFHDYVEFCCDDIPGPHMVEFRVTDKSGNHNTCMIEVTVQDKLPPILTCPEEHELDCSEVHLHPDYLGYPTVVDNNLECYEPIITWEDFGDLDQCGVGHIERVWTATDPVNENLVGTCIQDIWLYDYDPFDEDDIHWPYDYDAYECNGDLLPENLPEGYNYPDLWDDECSLTAKTYKDQIFEFVPGACAKIIRTWTVIDWCQYEESWPTSDPNNNGYQDGIWEYTQIIKLINDVAPEFVFCPTDTTFYAGYGPCEQEIVLVQNATDDCTPDDDLNYHWEIDLYNDGIPDEYYNGYPLFGYTNDASGTYPFGCHRIKWVVEDFCGNTTTCKDTFCIEDKKKPTPYCYSSITTVVMNSNGEVEIWANDFDLGSTDNCSNNLYFSFSSDVDSTFTIFTCEDVQPSGVEEIIELQMWVTDDAGNQDFCEITLVLQDNEGDACDPDDGARVSISGSVRTDDNRMVESAEVMIESETEGFPNMMHSLSNGSYGFDELEMNYDYTISATRGEDYLNGVSTLDLVLMQKHVLGIQALDSPYKIIAADIDGNESVSAIDLINLRKLILGIFDEMPNNQPSWKFVDSDQVFFNDLQPWPVREYIELDNINSNMYNQDLIAVKLGDVTYNANVANLNEINVAESRSSQTVEFMMDDLVANTSDNIDLPVYLEDLDAILGFQFTLELNNEYLEFNGVKSAQIQINEENVAAYNDMTLISWHEAKGVVVDADAPLFYINVNTASSAKNSHINLTSEILNAEIYDLNEEVHDLSINVRTGTTAQFVLEQNVPNPFSEITEIKFYNPSDANLKLTVTDLQGKTLISQDRNYERGNHSIQLNATDLPAGVLYYTLESDEWKETKRMIVLK